MIGPVTGLAFLLSISSPIREPPKSSITLEKYETLLTWFNSTFPTSYISPSMCIAESSQGGYGAFASSEIEKDALLLSIPRTACVTTSVALDDKDCGEAFQALIKKAGPGSETVAMAGYLAKEYLIYLEGGETVFGPYFATLPWDRGMNGQEHILFWSQEDVDTYLKDTFCWTDSADLRGEVKIATDLLNQIVGPAILSARDEEEEEEPPILPFLNWVKPKAKPLTEPVAGLKEAVTGAFVILLTRAFDDDYKGQGDDSDVISEDAAPERLIPLLDMFNHNKIPSIRYKTNEKGTVEVRARRDLKNGEEIFNQYREEEELTMPKHRFFTRFGFIPGNSDNIYDLLADKEGMFYAKRQEV